MEIRVIQASESHKNKHVNAPLAGIVGGLSGYAFKYALPLNMAERNEATGFQYEKIIKQKVNEAKTLELEELAKMSKKNPKFQAADLFIRRNSKNKGIRNAAFEELSKAGTDLKKAYNEIKAAFTTKIKVARSSQRYLLDSSIKNSRTAFVCIVPGIVLGLAGAFVYNVIGKFKD